NHPASVRVGERMTDLTQQVDNARRRERAELANQRFEIAASEQLHHVVKGSLLCDAEIKNLNRVRRAQCGCSLCFALEAAKCILRFVFIAGAEELRTNQFDRRVAGEQAMLRAPDFA